LRDGALLEALAPLSGIPFSGALVMPNLNPPIDTTSGALEYKRRITNAAGNDSFEPYMTLFFHEGLDEAELSRAKEVGIFVIKLYPKGATTGSESGVSEILTTKTKKILSLMEEYGFMLSIHGETKGFSLERESEFLPIYETIAHGFPNLKIIIEHMSDRRSLKCLERHENLYGTLTLHHLLFTLDDLLGNGLNPHLFCKPILKSPQDRDALLEAALNANPKIAFGSDSAPHTRENKECGNGSAGIFSAPLLLPSLAELFEQHNSLGNLQAFVSDNARHIYGLTPPPKQITLEKIPMEVRGDYFGVVPLCAGKQIGWRVGA